MTKEKKPVKVPKGTVLVEFLIDAKTRNIKGLKRFVSKENAEVLVKAKKAKVLKEYSSTEEMIALLEKGADIFTVKA